MTVEIGDRVHYKIASDGFVGGPATVIGRMAYSHDVILVATRKAIGMPINVVHVTKVEKGGKANAFRLRKRFTDTFGTEKLEPLA